MPVTRLIKRVLASAPFQYTLAPLLRSPGIHVLMYHRIGSLDPEFCGLELTVFRDHLRWLKQHCTLITVDQMENEAFFDRRKKPAVLLTFDDGFRDFVINAYPVLEEHRAPALVFLPTEAVRDGGTIWPETLNCWLARARAAGAYASLLTQVSVEHRGLLTRDVASPISAVKAVSNQARLDLMEDMESQLRSLSVDVAIARQMMTWDEIASTQPLVEYGAHTHTHPIVSSMTEDAFSQDMQLCCETLEAGLGMRPRTFAWPNGRTEDFTPGALDTLKSLGFNSIFTTVEGTNKRDFDKFAIRRIPTTTPDASALNALMLRAS